MKEREIRHMNTELAKLQEQHRRLDEDAAQPHRDDLDLQRIKKMKLALRDRIEALQARIAEADRKEAS